MKPIQHAACLCALSALLALSPAVALCENTPAENRQAEDDRLQTGKQANLRKLPNKKSDKLETLKKGSVLTVISVSEINGENWAYVRTQSGRDGYILYELLEPVPTPTPEPDTPSDTPTPTPPPSNDEPPRDPPHRLWPLLLLLLPLVLLCACTTAVEPYMSTINPGRLSPSPCTSLKVLLPSMSVSLSFCLSSSADNNLLCQKS